jgi:hypothetical protein
VPGSQHTLPKVQALEIEGLGFSVSNMFCKIHTRLVKELCCRAFGQMTLLNESGTAQGMSEEPFKPCGRVVLYSR